MRPFLPRCQGRFCDWRVTGDPEAEDHAVQRYGKSEVILAADCTYEDISTHLVRSIEALLVHSCKENTTHVTDGSDEAIIDDPIEAQEAFRLNCTRSRCGAQPGDLFPLSRYFKKRKPHLKYFDCTAFAMAACERTPLFSYGYKRSSAFYVFI